MNTLTKASLLVPVNNCLVQNSAGSIGIVLDQRQADSGSEVQVQWIAERRIDWRSPSDLSCGFKEQMWVRLVASTLTSESEIGQIVQFREIGQQFQALVDFPASGRRLWLPYQLLSREMDLREQLFRGKLIGEGSAERFRLRCLAYALEIWNENTGALSGLEIEPLPHQVSLVHHILASGHFNWLIADDVGLGKTIEVGLLLNAQLQKEPEARVLIVCPAGLTTQWQEEMRYKFGLKDFEIYGKDFNIEYTDQWFRHRHVIASIDRLKHEKHLEILQAVQRWDLVVFDEAHRLTRHERGNSYSCSERFNLAQELRKATDSLLLLTATPHQGKDDLFRSLLYLLRPELRKQINLLNSNREILLDMVIRNPKSEVRNWDGELIFQGKEVRAVKVGSPPGMAEFTKQLEDYFRAGYQAAQKMGSKGQAVGFVMTVYRKLAASSIFSITQALERRLKRLRENEPDPVVSSDEVDERYQGEQEENLANAESTFFPEEQRQLEILINQGRSLIPKDLKIAQLLGEVIPQIQSKARHEKVVIFTEYRTTQLYLESHLARKFGPSSVVLINGSMSIDQRRESIRKFEDDALFLISTEAGGEGINLQRRCHTMVNYDIPWNPTRLVQRVGRLYRYGQKHPVLVFNLNSSDTLDQRIVSEIHARIDRIVQDLGVLGGDYKSGYRDEVLGQIAELSDLESLFESAYQKQDSVVEAEMTDALRQARVLYEERKDIFAHFTQTLLPGSGQTLVLRRDHLEEFVHGMLSALEISISSQTKDGRTLTLTIPEPTQKLLRSGRSSVKISFERDALSTKGVEVLDWNSSFLQGLLRVAKSAEFGGQVACVEDLPGRSLVLSTLYWQSSYGRRARRELSLARLDQQGQATLNPPELLNYLLGSFSDAPLPDQSQRRVAFEEVQQQLNARLAEASNPHLHPEGMEFLALAVAPNLA